MKIQIIHVARIDREFTISGEILVNEDPCRFEDETDYVEIDSIKGNGYDYDVERLYILAPDFMDWIEEEFAIRVASEQGLLYDYNDYIDYEDEQLDDYDN